MNTRSSTVLAAPCLTPMALGSSPASIPGTVYGDGLFKFGLDIPKFVVRAENCCGGYVAIKNGGLFGFDVTWQVSDIRCEFPPDRGYGEGKCTVNAQVVGTDSPIRFPLGRDDTFVFLGDRGGDQFEWSGEVDRTGLIAVNIKVNPERRP